MKKVVVVAAIFAVITAIAFYVALAPISPSVESYSARTALAVTDKAAAALIAIAGRGAAVLALLASGVIVPLLAIAAMSPAASARPKAPPRRVRKSRRLAPEEAPEPAEPPAEGVQAARLAKLRQRAAAEDADSSAGLLPAMPPPPVVLVRKAREPERSWFDDRSWFGGLPRLGDAQWPRDAGGMPLPFAAQIDLAELAGQCPENVLPKAGSLAFFLGTGAVVLVPGEGADFADPPADLPAAYDEGGYPFPAKASRLSRFYFPFWPVEPIRIELSEEVAGRGDGAAEQASAEAAARQLSSRFPLRSAAYAASGEVAGLWWHGVRHFADQIHLAHESAARLIALRQDSVEQAERALAALDQQGEADSPLAGQARGELASRQAALAAIRRQREALPELLEVLDRFSEGRDPWQPLTPEEGAAIEELLHELDARYGEIVRYQVAHSASELRTQSLRAMVTGTPEAVAAMPRTELDRINREFRLPPYHHHQMFGFGDHHRAAGKEHRGDLLLLQLAYDDMMEWRWGDKGIFQFWIGHEDAAAGNWDAVRLTFEGASAAP